MIVGVMKHRCSVRILAAAAVALVSSACSRASDGAPRGTGQTISAATPTGECGHAICADNFFIDTSSSAACAPDATCTVDLRLFATGDFHVNDEYPYRFKADDAKDVQFFGVDGAGTNVFSKSAGDWRKTDAKSGVMTVKFAPKGPGPKTIAGTFKLSVCSLANCLLEQRQVSAVVPVK
jgi:hypothetical protein